MSELYELLKSDPWGTIYDCLRGKCDLGEIADFIREYLSKPISDKEYFYGLEALRALKSQASIDKLLSVLRMSVTRDLLDKIIRDTEPSVVIDEYLRNYLKGMGLLTLLELYPLFGLSNRLVGRVKELLRLASQKVGDEKQLREFLRSIIYGPLSVIPPERLSEILSFAEKELPDKPLCLQFKADLLAMIPENYPSKIFLEHSEILESMASLLRSIAEKTILLIEKDLERAIDIYNEVNLFVTRLRRICEDLGRFDLCQKFWEETGDSVREMYNRMGKLIISLSSETE